MVVERLNHSAVANECKELAALLFSREYYRVFGAPPIRDTERLRIA